MADGKDDLKSILGAMRQPSDEDKKLVEKAYRFAAEAHKNHKRLSGEPYLVHLVETAKGLALLGLDAKIVAAGLLHDSIEDVGVKSETIEQEFGIEIAFLVDGVTKLGQLKYRGAERHRESLRKLLVATSRDVRVLIIKLMDRLHNMRTLEHVPPEKRQRIAMETLEIYAPIAHRLGMSVVRRELEDLAFKYAHPEVYASTRQYLMDEEDKTQKRLTEMASELRRAFKRSNIKNVHIDYRVKGLYSLWRKLQRKGDIGSIHDIAALRVLVDSIADCYRVLGVVHELWQPLPGKIKDYIAFPKPNGYRSLHTTVFAGDGGIVEVQIRTSTMHDEAEYGIASHVYYKERSKQKNAIPDGSERRQSSFDWIKRLIPSIPYMKRKGDARPEATVAEKKPAAPDAKNGGPTRARLVTPGVPEWLAELGDQDEQDFEFAIRRDFFSHRVFVFTPKGDVVDLPSRSSPIDFAYAIHSDIGDHISGAKVNGKLVPLDTDLHNGDIVEIETRKSAHPTRKWLDVARTTLARRHIRNALDKKEA
ncbi:MAG: RelA/SpoT family protein [Minisyncoccia bacterium]